MIFDDFAAILDNFAAIFDDFATIFDDFVAVFDDSAYTTIIQRLYNDFAAIFDDFATIMHWLCTYINLLCETTPKVTSVSFKDTLLFIISCT